MNRAHFSIPHLVNVSYRFAIRYINQISCFFFLQIALSALEKCVNIVMYENMFFGARRPVNLFKEK